MSDMRRGNEQNYRPASAPLARAKAVSLGAKVSVRDRSPESTRNQSGPDRKSEARRGVHKGKDDDPASSDTDDSGDHRAATKAQSKTKGGQLYDKNSHALVSQDTMLNPSLVSHGAAAGGHGTASARAAAAAAGAEVAMTDTAAANGVFSGSSSRVFASNTALFHGSITAVSDIMRAIEPKGFSFMHARAFQRCPEASGHDGTFIRKHTGVAISDAIHFTNLALSGHESMFKHFNYTYPAEFNKHAKHGTTPYTVVLSGVANGLMQIHSFVFKHRTSIARRYAFSRVMTIAAMQKHWSNKSTTDGSIVWGRIIMDMKGKLDAEYREIYKILRDHHISTTCPGSNVRGECSPSSTEARTLVAASAIIDNDEYWSKLFNDVNMTELLAILGRTETGIDENALEKFIANMVGEATLAAEGDLLRKFYLHCRMQEKDAIDSFLHHLRLLVDYINHMIEALNDNSKDATKFNDMTPPAGAANQQTPCTTSYEYIMREYAKKITPVTGDVTMKIAELSVHAKRPISVISVFMYHAMAEIFELARCAIDTLSEYVVGGKYNGTRVQYLEAREYVDSKDMSRMMFDLLVQESFRRVLEGGSGSYKTPQEYAAYLDALMNMSADFTKFIGKFDQQGCHVYFKIDAAMVSGYWKTLADPYTDGRSGHVGIRPSFPTDANKIAEHRPSAGLYGLYTKRHDSKHAYVLGAITAECMRRISAAMHMLFTKKGHMSFEETNPLQSEAPHLAGDIESSSGPFITPHEYLHCRCFRKLLSKQNNKSAPQPASYEFSDAGGAAADATHISGMHFPNGLLYDHSNGNLYIASAFDKKACHVGKFSPHAGSFIDADSKYMFDMNTGSLTCANTSTPVVLTAKGSPSWMNSTPFTLLSTKFDPSKVTMMAARPSSVSAGVLAGNPNAIALDAIMVPLTDARGTATSSLAMTISAAVVATACYSVATAWDASHSDPTGIDDKKRTHGPIYLANSRSPFYIGITTTDNAYLSALKSPHSVRDISDTSPLPELYTNHRFIPRTLQQASTIAAVGKMITMFCGNRPLAATGRPRSSPSGGGRSHSQPPGGRGGRSHSQPPGGRGSGSHGGAQSSGRGTHGGGSRSQPNGRGQSGGRGSRRRRGK